MTFIRYPQNQKIGEPYNLKSLRAGKRHFKLSCHIALYMPFKPKISPKNIEQWMRIRIMTANNK
jgi:hypothetical protein